jgi:hypothetical protein
MGVAQAHSVHETMIDFSIQLFHANACENIQPDTAFCDSYSQNFKIHQDFLENH